MPSRVNHKPKTVAILDSSCERLMNSQEPFFDRLSKAIQRTRTPVMVGIDPRWENLPPSIRTGDGKSPEDVANDFHVFGVGVIDAVASLVPVIKPQAAFFEQLGPPGMIVLGQIIDYAVQKGLLVCLDAKRNDIGSTAEAYATAYLGRKPRSGWGADALTVSPYLGDDSLEPFTKACVANSAGIFVLVKTSNRGGQLFQDREIGDKRLYELVADHVESISAATAGSFGYGVAGAVVGATYPEQLAELRQRMPHVCLLVPGFGAQGGAAKDVVGAFDSRGLGAVINNSRGNTFAYEREPYKSRFVGPHRWQDAIAAATHDMIDQLRAETPAGKL